ncbi:ABC transporter permease subunit [Sanguibacter antarcticus]|uniref:ABC-2 type transport system permease protein n=1 Tax=Sanguibacter antarcticus TaxID=372484 RepID=A0A2A9E6C5_9MICO|nr:ABC transporter permease subunit [Sanguibacter antarcticus]PFG34518.1 ABC-2 type transport system permease protein [Sanguibacter antarcticus]
MRLLKVEIQRFFARRLVLVGAVLSLAVVVLALVGLWDGAKPLSDEEQAWAVSNYEEQAKYWEENGDEQIAGCYEGEAEEQEINPAADWGCDQMTAPRLEDWIGSQRELASALEPALADISSLFVVLAFLLGAGFVAAEISTGALGNWLTFEPRRVRVYASKVAAAALGTIPIVLGLVAVFVVGAYGIFASFDALGDLTGDVWGGVASLAGRSIALAAVVAALGVGVGALLKHTAAALGVLVGYMIVFEGIVSGLAQAVRPYLLLVNIDAVTKGEGQYWVEVCTTEALGQSCMSDFRTVSLAHGVTVIGVLTVVVVVVAGVVFRRRDVS